MRLFNSQKELKDDFDWNQYHLIYKEELISTSRVANILPKPNDFIFKNNKLEAAEKSILPLLEGHHLLYEIILSLNPTSILEVGCGGGDHLRNLSLFKPELRLNGVDRSEKQLETLRSRHPHLQAHLQVQDMTISGLKLQPVDIVYTQAVLMHISEGSNRFKNVLDNMFNTAQKQIVLVENWTHHNFMEAVQNVIATNKNWEHAKIYYTYRSVAPNFRALVISKVDLPYEKLTNYDQLVMGVPLHIRN